MYLYLGSHLALCMLVASVCSAPIMQDSVFQDIVENAHSLITKILNDIPAAHKSWIYTESISLNETDKFQYLREQINLPAAPALQPISDDFTLDVCLSRMNEALQLHTVLLKVISIKIKSESTRVDGLLHDIRDLLLLVHELRNRSAPSGPLVWVVSETQLRVELDPRLNSEYKVQVAAHLVLFRLLQLAQDISRSFQAMQDPVQDTQDEMP